MFHVFWQNLDNNIIVCMWRGIFAGVLSSRIAGFLFRGKFSRISILDFTTRNKFSRISDVRNLYRATRDVILFGLFYFKLKARAIG